MKAPCSMKMPLSLISTGMVPSTLPVPHLPTLPGWHELTMLFSPALTIAILMVGVASVLSLWRLLIGPDVPDRILALYEKFRDGVRHIHQVGVLVVDAAVDHGHHCLGRSAANGPGPGQIETLGRARYIVIVPLFIETGEVLKVDTRTGEYISRVKE